MAILVSLGLVAFTAEVKSPTAGQVWVRLSGSAGRRDVFVCSAHMPQESDKKEVREISFRSLQDDVVKHGKKGEVLVLADLNAKLGEPNPGVEAKVMGRFGEGGVRSGNGKLAVRLLCEAGLRNLGGQSFALRRKGQQKWLTTGTLGMTKSRGPLTLLTTSWCRAACGMTIMGMESTTLT